MPPAPKPCLFDDWRAGSAPVFHMSRFWPAFEEAEIEDFLKSDAPRPAPAKTLNTAAASDTREVIRRYVRKLEKKPEEEFACVQAYLDFEAERLAALDLVLADGDQEMISQANDRLYGSLDSIFFADGLAHLADHLDHLQPQIPAAEAARSRVMQAWAHITPAPLLTEKFAAIEQARLSLRPIVSERFSFVDDLLSPYPPEQAIGSVQLAGILDQGLDHILGRRKGVWQAAVKPAVPNVHIDNDGLKIIIPAGRQYTLDHVRALIVHEIGVHVERAVNGARSRERLAGFGLAGYGAPEEAFGVLLSNATAYHYQVVGGLTPLAVIEYASRPHQPDFREVFEFASDLVLALANPDDATYSEKAHRYRRAAFSRVWRVLRLGQPGLVERSTTKYWRGLTLMSGYLNSHKLTRAKFNELLLGKYDPLNPAHLELIKRH